LEGGSVALPSSPNTDLALLSLSLSYLKTLAL
jgi:hypothetical protein